MYYGEAIFSTWMFVIKNCFSSMAILVKVTNNLVSEMKGVWSKSL